LFFVYDVEILWVFVIIFFVSFGVIFVYELVFLLWKVVMFGKLVFGLCVWWFVYD